MIHEAEFAQVFIFITVLASPPKAKNIIRLIIKKLKQIFLLKIIFLFFLPAPPDISVEKTWIHAAERCDIQLACTLHGDVNSEVSL